MSSFVSDSSIVYEKLPAQTVPPKPNQVEAGNTPAAPTIDSGGIECIKLIYIKSRVFSDSSVVFKKLPTQEHMVYQKPSPEFYATLPPANSVVFIHDGFYDPVKVLESI